MPKITSFAKPPELPQLEEDILAFWEKTQAFEKSVEMRDPQKAYVFYDGPPFATGMPHYGHLLASTTKDVIPRYWTMKGYRVERVWGWDCHGLPIENMIEQKLDIKGGKKGIEELGIDKFNAACRSEVMMLDKEWKEIITRLGRWVDFDNNYKTMDTSYMESIWWAFKEMQSKGLVYQGKKVVLYCPRCATPLSNFEIAMDNSYEDTEDWSIYVKFKVKQSDRYTPEKNEYLLAWTTTPWTLPGNVALAVDPAADYSLVKHEGNHYWVAATLLQHVFTNQETQKPAVVRTVKGEELVDIEYEPLFDYLQPKKRAYYVAAGDFVSLEDGTGIVHTAALFGEDDYRLALELDLPLIPTLDEQGKFLDNVPDVAGMFYKKAEAPINDLLEKQGNLFRKERITHSYPFCYRCGTPLFYNAVPAWFIDVQQIKSKLIENNQQINWFPAHLKEGRFGKGLENAPDWNISRSRYWGTPMPIWANPEDPNHIRIIGSIEELQTWAVEPEKAATITDIHREYIDQIEVWIDDAKTIRGTRIPEVFDCWVESGSMPFASRHFPFEHEQEFKDNYPAQFISEYIAQTRAWFYCMHVISTAVFDAPAFENALTTGTILAEDGTKMSKSKKNYPDPMNLINQYGVDSLRLYLMSSVVMKAGNLNFSEKEVQDIRRKVFVIWWNVLRFYMEQASHDHDVTSMPASASHPMDKWLINRIEQLTQEVTQHYDGYDLVRASRAIMSTVDEISTWYLRLSRDRLRADDNQEISHVFGAAIYRLALLAAPITPFFSELIHHQVVDDTTSIHHMDWPISSVELDSQLMTNMDLLKQIVELGHAERSTAGIKVRQPLAKITVQGEKPAEIEQLEPLLLQELNVKTVVWEQGDTELVVSLDTELTPELKAEGEAREAIRTIQRLRKKAGVNVTDTVAVQLPEWPTEWEEQIKAKTQVSNLTKGSPAQIIE